jgi:hypothetical protein
VSRMEHHYAIYACDCCETKVQTTPAGPLPWGWFEIHRGLAERMACSATCADQMVKELSGLERFKAVTA